MAITFKVGDEGLIEADDPLGNEEGADFSNALAERGYRREMGSQTVDYTGAEITLYRQLETKDRPEYYIDVRRCAAQTITPEQHVACGVRTLLTDTNKSTTERRRVRTQQRTCPHAEK